MVKGRKIYGDLQKFVLIQLGTQIGKSLLVVCVSVSMVWASKARMWRPLCSRCSVCMFVGLDRAGARQVLGTLVDG